MTNGPIRVGIIGADTRASWAGASHVPALAAQPALTLAAVATRHSESARAAAEAFGADAWFADPYAMIADPGVDVVTVAVKVPAHRQLVLAALAAGKAVYSESPLGTSVAQAEEMAAAAGSLHTAICLARCTPRSPGTWHRAPTTPRDSTTPSTTAISSRGSPSPR